MEEQPQPSMMNPNQRIIYEEHIASIQRNADFVYFMNKMKHYSKIKHTDASIESARVQWEAYTILRRRIWERQQTGDRRLWELRLYNIDFERETPESASDAVLVLRQDWEERHMSHREIWENMMIQSRRDWEWLRSRQDREADDTRASVLQQWKMHPETSTVVVPGPLGARCFNRECITVGQESLKDCAAQLLENERADCEAIMRISREDFERMIKIERELWVTRQHPAIRDLVNTPLIRESLDKYLNAKHSDWERRQNERRQKYWP